MLQILSVRRGREVPRYDLYGRQHTWAPFCFPNVFQERCSKHLQGFPSVFQTSQPDFPDSKRLFSIFRDENSQTSFLAVFSRILGLEGGGQRPLNVFFAKIGTKVPEIFSVSFTPYSAWFHKVWR